MDLGCYILNAARQFGRWLDQAPSWSEPKPTYQLAALADTLQTGAEFLIDVDDSVANAELIDEVYRKAGLLPRG